MTDRYQRKLMLKGICKSFPGVKALQHVNLELLSGEVHVLCGENGAGKSTLMHILSGNIQPDEGTIYLYDRETVLESPMEAIRKGIAIVYQERSLAEDLSVAENIFANRHSTGRLGLIAFKEMYKQTSELLAELMLDSISPTIKVKHLSSAQKQMIEIAKALSVHPSILILDEPTASLTEKEIRLLFGIISRLRTAETGIIYISHRMKEIFEIGDRITVLKDGENQGTMAVADTTQEQLVRKMTGRSIPKHAHTAFHGGPVALAVNNLSGNGFSDISFRLHRGEILALSGLVGSGRTEIARTIFGADPALGGECYINGRLAAIEHPADAIGEGIAYIPEERKDKGLFLGMTIAENILSVRAGIRPKQANFSKKKRNLVRDLIEHLRITPALPGQKVANLSGGNQQKVVLAKWLLMKPQIIIADEPTHGIDVAAKFEIHQLFKKLSENGNSILLISSELPEILTLAHRILVICNGKITASLSREEATEETIMLYASGVKNMPSRL